MRALYLAVICHLSFFSTFVQASVNPVITDISAVAPDVLAITVTSGRVIQGEQRPYAPEFGDRVVKKQGPHRWLQRRGRYIGSVVGRENNVMFGFDRFEGNSLDVLLAEQASTYYISSDDDLHYKRTVLPVRVSRKSRPTNMAQVGLWEFKWPMEHKLYLQLPRKLKTGASYKIGFARALFQDHVYVHNPARTLSEAVHVSHLGFREDDAVKVAYLSLWKGNGGGQAYAPDLSFSLIDNVTDKPVFSGTVQLSRTANQAEDPYGRNYNKTNVYMMNFSHVETPGSYRVCVDEIGCSYPFPIAEDVWEKAFITSARGLYHQRSGIALGAPYTNYQRPRNLHPDDGVSVFASAVSLMDTGNGLNARGTDRGNFHNLNTFRSEREVGNAWGGYADAGDWDRRIQHLKASRLMLELLEMFPHYFASVSLNIPESKNRLPDVMDEALWGLDIFKRLQTSDGGIRGGIESQDHTRFGEGSWQESLAVMTYQPGMWSSYIYAGVAARAAHWLQDYDANQASEYRRSAIDAMQWAEKEYRRHDYQKLPHQLIDERNLAAVELYRLTGDESWHRVFKRTTAFKESWRKLAEWQHHAQSDAVFVYVQLEHADSEIKKNAMAALTRTAGEMVTQGQETAFRWTKENPRAWVGWGTLSVPQAVDLVRAHYLTGDEKYLDTTLFATQFGAGANPANMTFTTGLGHKSPLHPLIRDHRVSNQAPPEGITLNGPHDVEKLKDQWTLKLLDDVLFPAFQAWPTTESYLDIYSFEPITEFTIQSTIAPNAYVWGYLAARSPAPEL